MLPIFVATDQLADVFAAGTIAWPGDLLVDELLQVIRQRNIHSAHWAKIASMAKFGKARNPGGGYRSRQALATLAKLNAHVRIPPASLRSLPLLLEIHNLFRPQMFENAYPKGEIT